MGYSLSEGVISIIILMGCAPCNIFFLISKWNFIKSVRRPSKYTGSIHKKTPKKAKKNEQENQRN